MSRLVEEILHHLLNTELSSSNNNNMDFRQIDEFIAG